MLNENAIVLSSLTPKDRRSAQEAWNSNAGPLPEILEYDAALTDRGDQTMELLNAHLSPYILRSLAQIIYAAGEDLPVQQRLMDHYSELSGLMGLDLGTVLKRIDNKGRRDEDLVIQLAKGNYKEVRQQTRASGRRLIDFAQLTFQGLALWSHVHQSMTNLVIHGDPITAQEFIKSLMLVTSRLVQGERPINFNERAPREPGQAFSQGEVWEAARLILPSSMRGKSYETPIEIVAEHLNHDGIRSTLRGPAGEAIFAGFANALGTYAWGFLSVREQLAQVAGKDRETGTPLTDLAMTSLRELKTVETQLKVLEAHVEQAQIITTAITELPDDPQQQKDIEISLAAREGYRSELERLTARKIQIVQSIAGVYKELLEQKQAARRSAQKLELLGDKGAQFHDRLSDMMRNVAILEMYAETCAHRVIRESDKAAREVLDDVLINDLPNIDEMVSKVDAAARRRMRQAMQIATGATNTPIDDQIDQVDAQADQQINAAQAAQQRITRELEVPTWSQGAQPRPRSGLPARRIGKK